MRLWVPVLLSLAMSACTAAPKTIVVIVTATRPPPTQTNPPPSPTASPIPVPSITPTPKPSKTPTPSLPPFDIHSVEQALRDAGYRRYPMSAGDGTEGFQWARENPYEPIFTWEDGSLEIQVLHRQPRMDRLQRLERRFNVLDQAIASEFMDRLRAANLLYNETVKDNVSGQPADSTAFGDDWNTRIAEYYPEILTIGPYDVKFSLWWWQSTCPPGYICWYENFPGLEFTGDSSLIFYTISIVPGSLRAPLGPSS